MRRLLRDRSRRFLLDDYVLVDFEDQHDTLHTPLRAGLPGPTEAFLRRLKQDRTALQELRAGVTQTTPLPLAFRMDDSALLHRAAALLSRGPLRLLLRQPAQPLYPVRWHEGG